MRTDTSRSDPAPTRAAATVAVVRDTAGGLEVLLLRRAERGDHNSGAWVFPGGLVDAADREAEAFCTGLDAVAANARLGLAEGGLAFHAAALRECFEEAGLLFADDAHGTPLTGTAVERLGAWRGPLQRGERTLAALCRAERLTLPLARLAYISHWVTPVGRPKRFDTRFFVAEAPADQTALHDDGELVEHLWLRTADAVARGDALKLMAPTLKTLETLAGFAHVAPLMAWAHALREVTRWQPNLGTGPQGLRPVTPDEPAWAELGRIDPTGRGDGRYDIRPGVPVRLSPRVIRVTAPNPGVMTGPGTNSYLVSGRAQPQEWAVIDPGPADPTHIAALMAAAPGPIRWILATHTHSDHSPGCALLKAATGAAVLGRLPAHPQRQDPTFAPDELLGGGERIALADDTSLRVLHTPGHASNHLCYLLEEEQTLFTGDQVMQRSTVVISPPDGDMAAYLGSLQALAGENLQWLAPGHGFLMAQPQRVFESIVAHRLRREAKVLAVLQRRGPSRAEDLLAAVYDDVPERMHTVALGSLRAHLIHLRQQARADQDGDCWIALG